MINTKTNIYAKLFMQKYKKNIYVSIIYATSFTINYLFSKFFVIVYVKLIIEAQNI